MLKYKHIDESKAIKSNHKLEWVSTNYRDGHLDETIDIYVDKYRQAICYLSYTGYISCINDTFSQEDQRREVIEKQIAIQRSLLNEAYKIVADKHDKEHLQTAQYLQQEMNSNIDKSSKEKIINYEDIDFENGMQLKPKTKLNSKRR